MEGRELGHYRIESKLGAGGMGHVWLAQDTRLQREVALKFLHASLDLGDEARTQLLREARAASALDHPGILNVHSIEDAEGLTFVVTERLRGASIDEAVQERSRGVIIDLVIQVADALAAAHERGIVHRDIKPSNLFVDERGRAVVMDFGLAQVRGSSQTGDSESGVGTLGYTAPEQLVGRPVTASADVFSLGAVLYELLSGKPPFDDGTGPADVVNHVLETEPRPLEGAAPGLQSIVSKALAKDPAERFPDARAMGDALLQFQEEARRDEAGGSGSKSARWLAVGGLVLLAVVAGVLLLRSPSGPQADAWKQRSIGLFAERVDDPAISPDGARVAYITDALGTPQLHVATIADPSPRAITAFPGGARSPRWSPDGSKILVASRSASAGGSNTLYSYFLIPADTARVDSEAAAPQLEPIVTDAKNASFGAGGALLVFERGGQVVLADAATGKVVEGETPIGSNGMFDIGPALSPDGTKVAYFESLLGPLGVVKIWDRETGDIDVLIDVRGRHRDLSFSPDGKTLLLSSDLGGAVNLWSADLATGARQRLTSGAGDDLSPTMSGDRIAYLNRRDDHELVAYELGTGEERLLYRSRGTIMGARIDPSGGRVLFASDTGDGVHVFTLPIEGGSPSRVTTENDALHIFPRWLKDDEVMCYLDSEDSTGVVAVDLATGAVSMVAPGWTMQDHPFIEPRPGADSVAVFQVQGPAGPPGTRLMKLMRGATGERSLVAGGSPLIQAVGFRWSPRGDWAAFDSFGGGVHVLRIGEPGAASIQVGPSGAAPFFGGRGEKLYWRERASGALVSIDVPDEGDSFPVTPTPTVQLSDLKGVPQNVNSMDATADGTVIFVRFVARSSEVWLLQR